MLSKILSCATYGIEGYLVDVEVDLSTGLPGFTTVGLPDNAVKESKDRVFAAIKNAGFRFPSRKITVNLSRTISTVSFCPELTPGKQQLSKA